MFGSVLLLGWGSPGAASAAEPLTRIADVRSLTREEAARNLPALVRGKVIKTDEKGDLTAADGTPIGGLEIKARKASKKQAVRECGEPAEAEPLSVKLFLLGGDTPIKVLDEKKTPATRACSMGCSAGATYGPI
jgi:hypothetical protein